MLADPDSTSTSPMTLEALRNRGLLKALIESLVNPLPFGVDGDKRSDVDFEEKIIRYVIHHTRLMFDESPRSDTAC
jgi:hsp70-interacting protein